MSMLSAYRMLENIQKLNLSEKKFLYVMSVGLCVNAITFESQHMNLKLGIHINLTYTNQPIVFEEVG